MRRKLGILIISIAITVLGANSYAQISSAAVLFLRIAAGARAAGMGEAFVAISDDATATHWNPAGLGQYPLSNKWDEVKIPEELRPVRAIALFEGEGPEADYRRYDIWALSSKGLVRYNRSQWVQHDVVSAKADETIETLLRRYTGIIGDSEDERLQSLIKSIGAANNIYPPERLDTLEKEVIGALAEDYKSTEDIQNAFTALKDGYNRCRVDWERVAYAFSLSRKALKDSVINEKEADKILFAVEKSRKKYLPGEITIPFDVNFEGKLNAIAADDKYVWIAGESGLYRYNGRQWQRFGFEEGLPATVINSILIYKKKLFMGTDTGLVVYDRGGFTHYGPDHGLPHKPVSAVAVENDNRAWAVVDDDLFQFDGSIWKNYIEFKDTVDQAPDLVYDHMKIYDTPAEKEKYIYKYRAMNPGLGTGLHETDSADTAGAESAADSLTVGPDSLDIPADSQLVSTAEESPPEVISADSRLTASRVPFTAGFKFKVRDMAVDNFGSLWIGTGHGLLKFTGRGWRRYGYRRYTADDQINVFDLALTKVRGDSTRAERLVRNIKLINDLESDIIEAGQTVMIYANPSGARINDVLANGSKIIFATSSGTIYFDGIWGRYNARNLGKRNTRSVSEKSDNLWFLTADKIEVSAGAKKEVTGMHVNWLPELADDIYYEFFGYVQNVEGWGTIGTNITFLSYGKITRTSEQGTVEGEFSAYDFAFSLSYGTPLTSSLSGGISAKVIYSHLSTLGAGKEKGSGTSTGLALDLGLLYRIDPRLHLGLAVTNLGPEISYIDVSQADPLPRNLAIGLAWKMVQSTYNEVLFTVEANKSLAERDRTILEDFRDIIADPQGELKGFLFNPFSLGGLTEDFKNVIINGGLEYRYGSFFSLRGGYIHDEVGKVKTPTLGVGLAYSKFRFDFAYIPSSDEVPLANTMRFSLSVGW